MTTVRVLVTWISEQRSRTEAAVFAAIGDPSGRLKVDHSEIDCGVP